MFTLVVVIFGLTGSSESRVEHFTSMADCRLQAQSITGDKRKKVELVFQSPSGRAIAYCKPGGSLAPIESANVRFK